MSSAANIEPWSDLGKLPDLVSTLREGRRKAFMTPRGWAEALFCASCGREIGYVAAGTAASQLCGSCVMTHGGLPLPEPPNVALRCGGCDLASCSIPRQLLGKVVYYCAPCERRMGSRPPLAIMSIAEERRLGVKRAR